MKLLLDTHAFLWWLSDSPRLSPDARNAIAQEENLAVVSAVTAWEAALKFRLGRLPEAEVIATSFYPLLKQEGMRALSLSARHGIRAASYPAAHADPFDRMLAAQAELEGMVLVTKDKAFADFPIRTLW
jgi:PIN domain nuclease of toxin-antitoxin system